MQSFVQVGRSWVQIPDGKLLGPFYGQIASGNNVAKTVGLRQAVEQTLFNCKHITSVVSVSTDYNTLDIER